LFCPDNLPGFFLPDQDISAGDIKRIEGESYHYLSNVLRLSEGQKIVLFNNTEYLFLGEIVETGSSYISLEIIDSVISRNESNLHTVLLQGIPKSDKLEFIIQKTTELGISKIVPIVSSHSIKKLSAGKVPRYKKIAMEASRQSKRSCVPVISEPLTAEDYLTNETLEDGDLGIVFSQDGNVSLRELLQKKTFKRIFYAVGPEGDFSKEEKSFFEEKGFQKVALGCRILRSETAAIVVTGIIQYETGNLQ